MFILSQEAQTRGPRCFLRIIK